MTFLRATEPPPSFPPRACPRVAITVATVLALLATTVFAISSPSAAQTTRVGDQAGFSPGAGINLLSSAAANAQMSLMATAGATRVRLDINWAQVEATPGTYDWSVPDKTIGAATANGLTVLGLLSYAPSWAFNPNAPAGTPPMNVSRFADFAAAATARYGTVTDWEIWNEPNLESFWGKAPDVGEYSQLLDAAASAIRATSPNANVLTGGLAPAADSTTTISPLTFITDLYSRGSGDSFDAVAIHPYSYPELPLFNAPWNPFRIGMAEIHDVMVAEGDGAKLIWPTEFGAGTGTHPRAVSESDQRSMIVQALRCAAAQPWIGPIFIYNLSDPATGSISDLEDNFGLRRANGSAKASWTATQQKMNESVSSQSCPELDRALCNGQLVTVYLTLNQSPTSGDDVILGTNGPDVITSGFGNDTICGGGGTDRIDAGPGADWIDGGDGIDRIWGRDGNDIIYGAGGSDRLYGGAGNDTVFAGAGADRVYGGVGDDQLFGMGGQDRIRGDAGNDTLQGNHQSDDLWGGAGDDVIRGARGRDNLWGGPGNDQLAGGDNSDYLSGDSGADIHDGQRGNDACDRPGTLGDVYISC